MAQRLLPVCVCSNEMVQSLGQKILEKEVAPLPAFLPGESNGEARLSCNKESETDELA